MPVLAAMEDAGIEVDEGGVCGACRPISASGMAKPRKWTSTRPGRPPVQPGQPEAVLGEILFDEMKLPGWPAHQQRHLGHRRRHFAAAGRGRGELPARIMDMAPAVEAEIHLCRCPGGGGAPGHQPRPHHLRHGRDHHRPLSSNDPNLQNIPIRTEEGGRIRRAFVAAPGHVLLVSADYSQIELRLLAHVADVPALSEAFAERGGHPQPHRERGVRRADGGDDGGSSAAAPRRSISASSTASRAFGLARQLSIEPGEAKALYRRLLRSATLGIRAYMESDAGGGAHPWLRADPVRPPLLGAGHRRPQRRQARLCGAPGQQRTTAGRAPPTSSSAP